MLFLLISVIFHPIERLISYSIHPEFIRVLSCHAGVLPHTREILVDNIYLVQIYCFSIFHAKNIFLPSAKISTLVVINLLTLLLWCSLEPSYALFGLIENRIR